MFMYYHIFLNLCQVKFYVQLCYIHIHIFFQIKLHWQVTKANFKRLYIQIQLQLKFNIHTYIFSPHTKRSFFGRQFTGCNFSQQPPA